MIGNPEVRTLIDSSDRYLEAVGYTYHGITHVGRVGERGRMILDRLRINPREAELAEIAGYLHDIGNVIHRNNHPQSSAIIAFDILHRMGPPQTFPQHVGQEGLAVAAPQPGMGAKQAVG